MTRFRLRPCPRGFVVIECPYLMGEHMCQKLEIARDWVYYLEITGTRFETLFQPLLSGLQHSFGIRDRIFPTSRGRSQIDLC